MSIQYHLSSCELLVRDTGKILQLVEGITGDVNVPRGACSWHAFLRQESPGTDEAGRQVRAYVGQGRIAHHGFM